MMAFWYENVVFKHIPDPLADEISTIKLNRSAEMLEGYGLETTESPKTEVPLMIKFNILVGRKDLWSPFFLCAPPLQRTTHTSRLDC